MVEREAEIRKIVSRRFDSEVKGIEEPEAGISHSTYFVELEERDVVVKICESDWEALPEFEKGFEIDAPVMEEISSRSEVPVPEIFAFDNSEDEFDFMYLVSEKVEGRNISDFSDNIYLDLVGDLGKILGQLHENMEYDGSGAFTYKGGRLEVEDREWKSMFRDLVWTLTGHLDSEYEEFRPRIRELVDQNLHLAELSGVPSMVHQEMKGDNVLATEDGIAGIVDWERAFSGDPEYDLFATEIQLSQKPEDDEAGLRDNAGKIREALRDSYTRERELRDRWEKRRYLYYIPFIVQMMWFMEEKSENLINQFKEIEAELDD